MERFLKAARFIEGSADGILISSGVHMFYFTGSIFNGYIYLSGDGRALSFVRKRTASAPKDAFPIRKIEDIPAILAREGLTPGRLMVEDDYLSAREYRRVEACFSGAELVPSCLRMLRAEKDEAEVAAIAETCAGLEEVYGKAASLYTYGMTDRELTLLLEIELLKKGHLGRFPVFGSGMDIGFGGSVLGGDNAMVASPYDFAVGGAGAHPVAPIGACGAVLKKGQSVLLDMGLLTNGYMGDVSRCFSVGRLPDEAYRLHDLSIDICKALQEMGKPGVLCSELYNKAMSMIEEAQATAVFMEAFNGTRFVGHSLGLEINELPVLSGGYKQALRENMVLAIEPKFILPGVGPLGVENTYAVKAEGLVPLHTSPMGIVDLLQSEGV